MNYKLEAKDRASVTDENIIVNGQVVGWVKEYVNCLDELKYHCGLYVPAGDTFPALIQGHGVSKESAINNALDIGSVYADKLANGIAVLIAELRRG